MVTRLANYVLVPIAAVALVGCDDGDDDERSDKSEAGARMELKASPEAEKRAAEFESFVGARIKLVWAQQTKSGQTDRHANGKSLKLMALDSADSYGERTLVDDVGGNTRPLITPDGSQVVFSEKGSSKSGSKRKYRPRCFVVNFDGTDFKELGEGYAECLWEDPATGVVWVYVACDYKATKDAIVEGERIERFPLDDPKGRELVWDKTMVGADGFGLSRDGELMVGLFPWPDAGVVDLASGELRRTGSGCWTGIAPDNSGVTWIFDGAHRVVSFIDRDGVEISSIELGTHPDLRGHRVYHPRWVHPRFAVMSGPYLAGKKGADKVELYLAKLSEDLGAVDDCIRLTHNARADIYPDLWVEGGGDAELGPVAAVSAPTDTPSASDWPIQSNGLLFGWKSSRENVKVGDEICRVWPEGAARFGRRFDMAPGEGSFVVEALAEGDFGELGALVFEAVVTPAEANGTIARIGPHVLEQVGSELLLRSPVGGGEAAGRFGPFQPGVPFHLAIRIDGSLVGAAVNGRPAQVHTGVLGADSGQGRTTTGLRFGGGWDGRLERVALYRGDIPQEQLAASAAGADLERKPIRGRVKLRGRLLETTEAPDLQRLGSYRRALLYYLYEVEEVIEGELDAPRVVVAHWAILDRKPAAGLPAQLGASVLLEAEPMVANPQLKSEFREENISDIDAPVYFDIRVPRLLEDEKQ